MRERKILIFYVWLSCIISSTAQQLPFYSHYFFKPLLYNPAFAGDKGEAEIFALHRNQFSGFAGAPVFNLICVDANIKGSNNNYGFIVANQKKGLLNNTNILAAYAYNIKFNENLLLKPGFSIGILSQGFNFQNALAENLTDPNLFTNQQQKTMLDANAGIAVQAYAFRLGLSFPQLAARKIAYQNNMNSRSYYTQARHAALSLQYEKELTTHLVFQPFILTRYNKGAPLQYDIGTFFNWNKQVNTGIFYRSNYAFGMNFTYTYRDNITVGYNFDYLVGPIYAFTGGAHEFFLAFRLKPLKAKATNENISDSETPKAPINGKSGSETGKNNTSLLPEKNGNALKDIHVLENKCQDFCNLHRKNISGGYYVVAKSAYYKEQAKSEVKKLIKKGFKNASIIYYKPSKFYYVYLYKTSGLQDALKLTGEIKDLTIKNIWIQTLIN